MLQEFDFATDADAVCSFQEETYQLNFPGFQYTPAFSQAFRYDLRRSSLNPEHGLFVLRENHNQETAAIIGFLWTVIVENNWLGERYGYINNIYIMPAWRGQGLARKLIGHGEKYLRSRGVQDVRLTVTQNNASAVALYRACGYEVARWEMGKKLWK